MDRNDLDIVTNMIYSLQGHSNLQIVYDGSKLLLFKVFIGRQL